MGNKLKFFPRVDTIDFPRSEDGKEYDLTLYKKDEIEPDQIEGGWITIASSIDLLKTGNILIAYCIVTDTEIKAFLKIYSLPTLKVVQTYEFKQKTEGMYSVEYALQLKNGNILAIYDKFYEFDGENIQDGPKNISTKLSKDYFKREEGKFSHPKYPNKFITKTFYRFELYYIFEEQEGLLLYSPNASSLCSIKLENFEDIIRKQIYTTWKEEEFGSSGKIDIVLHSEYYPEYMYLIINEGEFEPLSSCLRIHNYEDFIKGKCNKKNVINKLTISNSSNVFGVCEYNKQYLLLDTIVRSIYIFDMFKKQKIALCIPTVEGVLPGRKPKNKFMEFWEKFTSNEWSGYRSSSKGFKS